MMGSVCAVLSARGVVMARVCIRPPGGVAPCMCRTPRWRVGLCHHEGGLGQCPHTPAFVQGTCTGKYANDMCHVAHSHTFGETDTYKYK